MQRVYYNQTYNFSYQWLVIMSTQLISFSIGGVARRFLISPPSMSASSSFILSTCHSRAIICVRTIHPPHPAVWPANLVFCALFNTLHQQHYSGMGDRGGLSRERFFLYAFIASFCWCTSSLVSHSLAHACRLAPGLRVHRAVVLLLGLLDCAQQHQGQPALRVRGLPSQRGRRLIVCSYVSGLGFSLITCARE